MAISMLTCEVFNRGFWNCRFLNFLTFYLKSENIYKILTNDKGILKITWKEVNQSHRVKIYNRKWSTDPYVGDLLESKKDSSFVLIKN